MLFSQKADTVYTFATAAEQYSSLNKNITITHTPVPVSVAGVKSVTYPLNGEWWFTPTPEEQAELNKFNRKKWHTITIPSEWYMESFEVEKDKFAGYYKEFIIPRDWKGKRTIIRFGAVESECKLYVNGKYAGSHQGSMTQFEKELTPFLTDGKNTLLLYVRSESFPAESSKISKYAKHQVGGIIRNVELITVPQVHINNFYCDALLSDDLKTGTLHITTGLSEKGSNTNIEVIIKKTGVEGLSNITEEVYRGKINQQTPVHSLKLISPQLWHAESPFLYTVELILSENNKQTQIVKKNIGFRKIEIRGNSLYVNNRQVKLRGVARHDISPYEGRAIKDTISLRKDIEQLRNANCNFIRTSHYPPHEYMLDLCDRLGIFVEDEAPVCWDSTPDTPARTQLIFYCFKSMLHRDRTHPSVLLWSIANESQWRPKFYPCMQLARELTPHIPVKFSHSEYQGIKKGPDIGAKHYPGWEGLLRYDNYFRPMLFGEALHLNCYNTSENITDPALRDLWGDYIKYFVDNMQESPAIAGLGIWGTIDEMFYPKDKAPCGYGPWGVVDGFRREKPEFWHMKMSYSPIVITSKHFQTTDNQTFVSIQNRYNVLNASNVDIYWQDGANKGKVTVQAGPGEEGTIRIPHLVQGDSLYLELKDRRGFTLSEWKLPRIYSPHNPIPELVKTGNVSVQTLDSVYHIQAGNIQYYFSRTTGMPLHISKSGEKIIIGPLKLYIIPLLKENEVIDFIPQERTGGDIKFTSDPLSAWIPDSVSINNTSDGIVKVTTKGKLDELPVDFTFIIDGKGHLRIDYMVNIKKVDYDIRQIGIGFNLPETFTTLSWKRKALWSVYPEDHIGRPEGTAQAFYPETLLNYFQQRINPAHPYSKDGNEFGSNDFRSTKHNIISGKLQTASGSSVTIESNGRQHLRAWILPTGTSFLVANYSNGGNEHYLNYDSNRTRYSGSLKADGGDFTGWMQLNFDTTN